MKQRLRQQVSIAKPWEPNSMKVRIVSSVIVILGSLVVSHAANEALAADSLPPPPPVRKTTAVPPTIPIVSPGEVAATPEMWFYEQALERYDNPKYAIRAAAEQRANQRRARMAAMEWYGYSNSRPLWGIDPVHGYLNPQWIGNGYDPFNWVAPAYTTVIWNIPGVASGF